eukprot:6207259-Pleurochrysis_carterae.AAC.3
MAGGKARCEWECTWEGECEGECGCGGEEGGRGRRGASLEQKEMTNTMMAEHQRGALAEKMSEAKQPPHPQLGLASSCCAILERAAYSMAEH